MQSIENFDYLSGSVVFSCVACRCAIIIFNFHINILLLFAAIAIIAGAAAVAAAVAVAVAVAAFTSLPQIVARCHCNYLPLHCDSSKLQLQRQQDHPNSH